jgi:hypothetical protein
MDSKIIVKQLSSIIVLLTDILEKVSRIDRQMERIAPKRGKENPHQEVISPEDYE